MDYDRTSMPAVFDAGRGYSRQVLGDWLRAIARVAGPTRSIRVILDLGCGTGRYSGPLANYFAARVIAVDPSEKMLEEARRKAARDVAYLRGSGEDLPLSGGSIDMVFMSMVFHHFARPAQVARECARVLRAGGVAVMRAGAAERIEAYPYVSFFPRTKSLLENTLSSVSLVKQTFANAGFEPRSHEVVMSEVAESWSDYAEKVSLRADSILIQLSDAEFAAGLERLRTHASTDRKSVIEPVDLLAFRRF